MSGNTREHDKCRLNWARQSFALSESEVKGMLKSEKDYDFVLEALVRNTKVGPFISTSGVKVPYYLNASTNFIDKNVAPTITRMVLDVLKRKFQSSMIMPKPLLVVGMETAGGIMVSQLAATAAITHPEFVQVCDFIYCRKSKKKTGTCQQLEGPRMLTERNSDSVYQSCIYLDDVNSTGSSLRDAIKFLKKEYNIVVKHAMYLVDRSADRSETDLSKIGLTDTCCDDVNIFSLYDYDSVLQRLPKSALENVSVKKKTEIEKVASW